MYSVQHESIPTKQLEQVCKIQHSLTKFVSFPLIKTLRYLCICTKAYQPYWHSSSGVIKQQGLENEVTLCSHRPPPCPLPLLFPVLINAVSASPFYLIWSEWTSTEGRYAHSVLVFTLFSLTYNDWWFHSSGGKKKKKKGYHRSQRIHVRTTIPLSDQGSAVCALFTICESPQLSSSGIINIRQDASSVPESEFHLLIYKKEILALNNFTSTKGTTVVNQLE